MLEKYKKRAESFINPKKKQIWQEISDEMAKYGYTIEADAIDKKFRNMKTRYLIIKDNNDKRKTTDTVEFLGLTLILCPKFFSMIGQ